MPSYSWVKLYIEVLDDPKMGRMTDDLWRRTIEVILLAGRSGNDGLLPTLNDMAWTLRLSIEKLESDLDKLEQMNIIKRDGDTWQVVNFAKRQAPASVHDRVAQYRERAKKQGYYEPETDVKLDGNESLQVRFTDTDTEKKKIQNKKQKGAEKTPRPRDLLFDAIAQVTCTDPATAGASIAKVESVLKKANPPYTSEEVLKFGADWPTWKDKPPTLWQLKEQIGAVRQNGNGAHKEPEQPKPRKVYQ